MAKPSKEETNIKLFGYDKLALEAIQAEAGKTAFELMELEKKKKSEMKAYNEAISALKERMEALIAARDARRVAPQIKAVGD